MKLKIEAQKKKGAGYAPCSLPVLFSRNPKRQRLSKQQKMLQSETPFPICAVAMSPLKKGRKAKRVRDRRGIKRWAGR